MHVSLENTHLYLAVEKKMRNDIRAGKYGNALPPIRVMAETYDVSESTMKKILGTLKQQKYIYSIQGKGIYVNVDFDAIETSEITVFMKSEKKGNPFYENAIQLICGFLSSDRNSSVRIVDSLPKMRTVANGSKFVILMEVNDAATAEAVEDVIGSERVIQFNCHFPGAVCSVCSDNFAGGYQSMKYLYELGYRRIGVISSNYGYPVDYNIFANRMNGVKAFCKEAGIELLTVEAIPDSYEKGFAAASELISKNLPSAIFCFTDLIAAGVLKYCASAGLQIPDDLSILGFGDWPLAEQFPVPLASSKEDSEGMISAVLERLKGVDIGCRMFKPLLKPRASVVPFRSQKKNQI